MKTFHSRIFTPRKFVLVQYLNQHITWSCSFAFHITFASSRWHFSRASCVANNETETNANCNNNTHSDASEETIKNRHHKINDFTEFRLRETQNVVHLTTYIACMCLSAVKTKHFTAVCSSEGICNEKVIHLSQTLLCGAKRKH